MPVRCPIVCRICGAGDFLLLAMTGESLGEPETLHERLGEPERALEQYREILFLEPRHSALRIELRPTS